MYFWPKPLAFLTLRLKINDLGRTWTCNPQIRSLVPYPLGHKATLMLEFRFISRPSTFRCQKYWIHPYQRYSNRYSKFLATLTFVFRFFSRPSTFWCEKYWIYPNQRYSNRHSKFLIIPHGLSIDECFMYLRSVLCTFQISVDFYYAFGIPHS